MRLKHVFISEYKNLKNFSITFDGDSFIDIFVGKNGSGKSNLLEALIEIFRHLYEHRNDKALNPFHYSLLYEIDGKQTKIEWKDERFFINNDKEGQKSFRTVTLPENVLIYYSGHNETITQRVRKYEDAFRARIKGVNPDESRRFIGIGPEYKSLLLSTLLLQPETCRSRKYICQKLSIQSVEPPNPELIPDIKMGKSGIILKLKRPGFADGRFRELEKEFGLNRIDNFDTRTHYWGADGITREFLEKLMLCVNSEEGFNHSYVYNPEKDFYTIPISIELFQKVFAKIDVTEQFRLFDNLKILGMLDSIEVSLLLNGNQKANLNQFSDGQFQSVYIYAITEIFKDRNCITLLDEPDSFLHPEWQFEFLKQIFEITDSTTKTNHVLMCSHSASTISTAQESTLNLFEFKNGNVVVNKVTKSEVIKSLSSGLITFTEGEAQLNINHFLKNTTAPVLFVEGITDEIILEIAWKKLFPTRTRKIQIQNAFGRIFLRNLFSRDELKKDFPNRKMFALFDFDEAYDDWNGLQTKSGIIESDPYKCLIKQLNYPYHYAMMLPVPNNEELIKQVLNPSGKPWGKGSDSHLSIELLFYGAEEIRHLYKKKAVSGGGEIIEFTEDKVEFANEIVPGLPLSSFEVIRPVFNFINSNC